ncbi:MAG TPA: hypothetical protein VFA20_31430 [Myxococcaceae bacterium]|nr:hypothetical protein [Myxococcaceae bacterium]
MSNSPLMEPGPPPRISAAFRAALAGKALLLLSIAALFAVPAYRIATGQGLWPLRVLVGLFLAGLGAYVAWAASLGLRDSALGRAERATGAVALQSRRAGYSLQLPDGSFVEFILWNPWQPLVPGQRYTVTFGRHSKVLVRPPEPEVTHPT